MLAGGAAAGAAGAPPGASESMPSNGWNAVGSFSSCAACLPVTMVRAGLSCSKCLADSAAGLAEKLFGETLTLKPYTHSYCLASAALCGCAEAGVPHRGRG